MPDISVCYNVGSTVTVVLTANSVSNVNAWQVNITFSYLGVVSQTPGSSWTGSSYASSNRTNGGSTVFGFALLNGASLTSTVPVTMLSITFRILARPAGSIFHIVLTSENSLLGTMLLNPSLSAQTFTTTDGSFANCSPGNGPVKSSAPAPSPAASTSSVTAPPSKPPGNLAYVSALQVLPTNNYTSDITLPNGDKVSWGYEATGLVNHDGSNRTWSLSNFGAGVRIAILDTGVNGTLTALQGQVAAAYFNYFAGTEDQYDHEGHGTAMASIVAAKHGTGMSGIAYDAQIYNDKVADKNGHLNRTSIAAGINWAVTQGVNIISMSFGGGGSCPSDVQSAINTAIANGISVVASAGNVLPQPPPYQSLVQAYDAVTYPGNCVGVLAISSYGLTPGVCANGELCYYNEAFGFAQRCTAFPGCPSSRMHGELSEFSLEGSEVRFAAPGSQIFTWSPNTAHVETLQWVSGTSPAAAFTAGLLALGYNRYGIFLNPNQRLWQMASPVFNSQTDSFFGYGLLNATKMLNHDGDVNGDGAVNIVDLVLVAGHFGQTPASPTWCPACDLNWDGGIQVDDLSLVGSRFGITYPVPPSKDVWGSNFEYNSFASFGYRILGVMGECGPACLGDNLTISAVINPNIAQYVTAGTNLVAELYINSSTSLSQTLLTLPGNGGGQTLSHVFTIPRNSFWQIKWAMYPPGAPNYEFGTMIYADFSLTNSLASHSWGIITYSTFPP